MRFNDILSSLPRGSWIDDPQQVLQHKNRVSLSKKECKQLLDSIRTAVDKNDAEGCGNYLFLGIVCGGDVFVGELKKSGILRLSRYSYRPEPIATVVSSLLATHLGFSADVGAYLTSVANLHVVASSLRKDHKAIRDWLAEKREAGVKSLLAILDLFFLKAAVGIDVTNKQDLRSRDPLFFSVNELADGFSSLLALYGNEFGPLRWNTAIADDAWRDESCLYVLVAAAHLATFRQWEFVVDRMGFHLSRDTEAPIFRLSAPSQEFLKAMEMGYIQSHMQDVVKFGDWHDPAVPSLRELGERLAKVSEEHGLTKLLEKPVRRYKFGFVADAFKVWARDKGFYREERITLSEASRALLTPVEQLLAFELEPSLRFRDIFRVWRLLQIMRHTTAATLIPQLATDPGVVFESLIPAFTPATLKELFIAAVDPPAADKIITMMTTHANGHVDIQYRSILDAGDAVLLPANVFANGNFFRNALLTIQKRLYEDGTVDPLSHQIEVALSKAGFDTRTGFEYDGGEIDVLAHSQGMVFAFECKNSLRPADMHELKTSHDYIETAAVQLTRFCDRWKDEAFRERVAKTTGWEFPKEPHLSTGIVMSNRMFTGLRINGHPVRGSFELESFLTSGTVGMGEESRCIWNTDKCLADDLIGYLERDTVHRPLWDSMRPFSERYVFADCQVNVDRMFLDMAELAKKLGFEKALASFPKMQEDYERFVSEFSMLDIYRKSQGGGHNE